MIDYNTMTIRNLGDGQTHHIDRFIVMWQTPFGLFDSPGAALARLHDNDMPPMAMRAVAVAQSDSGTYEVCP